MRNGFPKERFDGVVKYKTYLDDLLTINYIAGDGTIDMRLNQENFSLSVGESYLHKPRKRVVEIDPEVMKKENDSWRRAYSNIVRTKNLGLFEGELVRFME
ncbi:MAG: hypothetical protein ACE5PV_25170 [Candidatus Poribacteria bacterium]